MKTVINTVVMIMFAVGSMVGVYYLAVPAEHQIFKFVALVLMILVFGGLCFQLGQTVEKEESCIKKL